MCDLKSWDLILIKHALKAWKKSGDDAGLNYSNDNSFDMTMNKVRKLLS